MRNARLVSAARLVVVAILATVVAFAAASTAARRTAGPSPVEERVDHVEEEEESARASTAAARAAAMAVAVARNAGDAAPVRQTALTMMVVGQLVEGMGKAQPAGVSASCLRQIGVQLQAKALESTGGTYANPLSAAAQGFLIGL